MGVVGSGPSEVSLMYRSAPWYLPRGEGGGGLFAHNQLRGLKREMKVRRGLGVDTWGSDWHPITGEGLVRRHPMTPRLGRVVTQLNLS